MSKLSIEKKAFIDKVKPLLVTPESIREAERLLDRCLDIAQKEILISQIKGVFGQDDINKTLDTLEKVRSDQSKNPERYIGRDGLQLSADEINIDAEGIYDSFSLFNDDEARINSILIKYTKSSFVPLGNLRS